MTDSTSTRPPVEPSATIGACAAAFAAAAGLVAAGLSPWTSAEAIQAGTALFALIAVALVSSDVRPGRALMATSVCGSAVVVLASVLGATPPVIVAGVLGWICITQRLLGSGVSIHNSALTVPFLALLHGSLRRSLPPGACDTPVHTVINALSQAIFPSDELSACNSGSVYGAAAGTVAIVALLVLRTKTTLRIAGVLILIAALMAGRVEESVWPAFFAAAIVPSILSAWTGLTPKAASSLMTSPRLGWTLPLVGSAGAVALAFLTSGTSATATFPRVVGFIGAREGTFELEPRSTDPKFNPSVSPPRFGAFRDLLERQGFQTRDIESSESKEIEICDAFVTINFSGPTAQSFVDPLRRRVASGARLLVLADHTDLFGQCKPTHTLLDGTGIRLAFDSAVPAGKGEGWNGAMEAGRDPLFGPHSTGNGISWSVGCSLEVGQPARVLARATNGFADLGDHKKAGGLGTLGREQGEVLGGFALAADAPLGAGRVLVFGDTSTLQDVAIEEEIDFARRVGAWLLGLEARFSGLDSPLFINLALLLVLGAGYGAARYTMNSIVAVSVAILAVGECVSEARSSNQGLLPERSAKTLWIDASSLPGFELHGDGKSRVGPLIVEGRRAGYVVQLQRNPGPMSSEDMLVICEPARPLSPKRTRDILAMIESGGRILVCVGPRGAVAVRTLLDELGLSVGIPLGAGQMSNSFDATQSQDESNVRLHCGYELQGRGVAAAQILGRIFGRPVALMGKRGKGAWCVIADPEFPHAKQSDFLRGATLQGAYTFYRICDAIISKTENAKTLPTSAPAIPKLNGGSDR